LWIMLSIIIQNIFDAYDGAISEIYLRLS